MNSEEKIVDLTNYRKRKKLDSILVTLNTKEIFYTKGKKFLIGLLEHILKILKEN